MILALYGAGAMGREFKYIADETGQWQEIVFVDDHAAADQLLGCRVCGFQAFRKQYSPEETRFAVTIGEPKFRREAFLRMADAGFPGARVIHPSASISPDAEVGEGAGHGKPADNEEQHAQGYRLACLFRSEHAAEDHEYRAGKADLPDGEEAENAVLEHQGHGGCKEDHNAGNLGKTERGGFTSLSRSLPPAVSRSGLSGEKRGMTKAHQRTAKIRRGSCADTASPPSPVLFPRIQVRG